LGCCSGCGLERCPRRSAPPNSQLPGSRAPAPHSAHRPSRAKFIVDKNGNVVARSAADPAAIEPKIKELLAA
jgi:hypothetical protein